MNIARGLTAVTNNFSLPRRTAVVSQNRWADRFSKRPAENLPMGS